MSNAKFQMSIQCQRTNVKVDIYYNHPASLKSWAIEFIEFIEFLEFIEFAKSGLTHTFACLAAVRRR